MGTASRLRTGTAALGVGMVGLAGCQTYPAGFGGMTLPSPHYLKHQPQYFPPDPAFPLQRELASMQDPDGRAGAGGPLGGPAPGANFPAGQTQPTLPVQPPAPVGSGIQPPTTNAPPAPGAIPNAAPGGR